MQAPYARRRIDLSFQLGKGSFGSGGFDTVTLSGLRVVAQISLAAMPTPGATAQLRVYGMTRSHIDQLTKVGLLWNNSENKVLVSAGDDQSGMSTVFNGNVYEAYPELSEVPSSAFVVRAIPGSGIQLKPVPPTSFDGTTDAATALEAILRPAGLKLENSGVDVKLANPYFPGTVWEQAMRCVKAADCYGFFDSIAGALAIWSKNGARAGASPVISPANGMIGYPEYQNVHIKVRTLFDPLIKFGTKMQVKSGFAAADGEWEIIKIDYALASEMPNGPWEMTITGYCTPGRVTTSG